MEKASGKSKQQEQDAQPKTATEQLKLKYPMSVIYAVRQNIVDNYDKNDESKDGIILSMTRAEVLNRTATWHGLVGYGYTIRDWVGGIYNVELSEDGVLIKDERTSEEDDEDEPDDDE